MAAGGALPAATPLSIGASGHLILCEKPRRNALFAIHRQRRFPGHGQQSSLHHIYGRPQIRRFGIPRHGAAGGAWTGPGIKSSAAAGNRYYGVGFADGADHAAPGLTSGQIELKYALYGDILLQGNVNGSDFSILASNFGKGVPNGWEQGDFNYDGKVNATDFSLLASNFGKTASGTAITLPAADWGTLDSFAAANGLLADLPEPSGLMIAGIALPLLARRRRSAP